ncbi:MAG TPA: flagellar brake domain-containing protein [Thermotogota bacterium]|nr:flagellar brake domain-containing protein [Thermotogota bacterium]HPJ88923.1 flagellar brake domain-containing protein [Thermotogota bacterium]HPR95303.1 flagellar brake domain-containing protein [Thermotogota bacterium]
MDYFNLKVATRSVLEIGKPLLLDISDPDIAGVYKSSIFELDYVRKVMTIGMPSYKGQYVPIPVGVRAYVKMFDKSSMYIFLSKVISYEKNEEGFYVTYMTIPDEARKVQRRQFVRIPFFKQGSFFFKDSGDETEYNYITKDISAGGIMMVTAQKITIGTRLLLNLDIGGGIELDKQDSEIVRADRSIDTANQIYGVKYLAFSRSKEDRLVKYIFFLQQERRKKEKKLKEGS